MPRIGPPSLFIPTPAPSRVDVPRGPGQLPAGDVRAAFTPDGKGGGVLKLEYKGPLSSYDPVSVRIGERRGGRDWQQLQDVMLERTGNVFTARIAIAPGEKVEGLNLAFHAVAGRGQDLWDNAGRAWGSWFLDAGTGAISAR
jgi:hypothetical protein